MFFVYHNMVNKDEYIKGRQTKQRCCSLRCNKLTPYRTGDQLLLTANFKVT